MVGQIEQVELDTDSAWQDKVVDVRPSAAVFYWRHAGHLLAVFALSTVLVFVIELVWRGSFADTMRFFQQLYRPAWTTVGFYMLMMVGLDALFGRSHNGLLVIAPCALLFAWIGRQKTLYLGDPLYPTDFLYSRQIFDLLPLLVRERPGTAIAIMIATVMGSAGLLVLWRFWQKRGLRLDGAGRLWRLAVVVPLLAAFIPIMDYNSFSWARDRLRVQPIMWDQKENYAHNGFTMAFALNLPMVNVAAPEGYSADAVNSISIPLPVFTSQAKPDIIMVMSESFWDPTLLPGVDFNRDPIPTVRARQSGTVFSPEFGGMTANVEFEALTGFSNAFLPYGSIPYQQYVRRPLPSLATFLKSQGYATKAIHPYREWFWNRRNVYQAFGFDIFRSEENLPRLATRGLLASDAALMDEVINEANATKGPFFLFAVTLQGHGPYEPHRYKNSSIDVAMDAEEPVREAIRTYAEGAADADSSLKKLMDWAEKRSRPTILVFFGDHLPPLGDAYVSTGYMKTRIADRRAPIGEMLKQHETPLVIWSNRTGTDHGVGPVSPAFLPLHVLELAGLNHPYYTGFLGMIRDRYKVIDRHMLLSSDDVSNPDWFEKKDIDPLIRSFRLLQYDMMFGDWNGVGRFFPEMNAHVQVRSTFLHPPGVRPVAEQLHPTNGPEHNGLTFVQPQ